MRQLAVGKEPITPARHAAFTSAGPETRNIGAAISGSLRRERRAAGSDMAGAYLRTARSPMPTTTIDAAVMRRRPKPSFRTSVPMTAPKITLVSRSAVIGPSGRLLAAAR